MPVHTYTDPSSYPQIAEARWGRDLVLIDCEVGDVPATATGDWPTIAGRENLHEAHRRRATTSPGELLHRPEYGGGMVLFLGVPSSPAELARLGAQLRINAARDRRVGDVKVTAALDSERRVIVDLAIQPRGEPDADTITIVSKPA